MHGQGGDKTQGRDRGRRRTESDASGQTQTADALETAAAALDLAKSLLADNPSVLALELGWKITGGRLTGQPAIRITVDRKRAATEIAVEHLIPAEIGGLPTDVRSLTKVEPFGHDMVGGDQVHRIIWNSTDSPGPGTLGCIATRLVDSRAVMLSCEHVFEANDGTSEQRRDIFQPDISRCMGSVCNGVGYAKLGHIGNVHWVDTGPASDTDPEFYIDCAIGELETDDFARGVVSVGALTGTEDITDHVPEGSPLQVKKMGAATGFTEGLVVSAASDVPAEEGHDPQFRTILIRAQDGGGHQFNKEIRVPGHLKQNYIDAFNDGDPNGTVTDIGNDTLHFQVNMFGTFGDSGSAVVDSGGKVVGILYGGNSLTVRPVEGEPVKVPMGDTRACHIGPVMSEMGIRIDPASAVSTAQLEQGFGPGSAIATDYADKSIERAAAQLEARLKQSPAGRELVAVVKRIGREAVDLVHHRRRVTVTWHRNQGPGFAALLVQCIRDLSKPLPRNLNGRNLQTLLNRMGEVLIAEGSAQLAGTLKRYRTWVLEWLAGAESMEQAIANLNRRAGEAVG